MTAAEHPDWPAFMAAIVANPDDDTVRLVAADFLEEHGDTDRAAFIRIQVELARLEATGAGKGLEADHLRAKERAFLGPLSTLPMFWGMEACPELVKMPFREGGRAPLEAMSVQGADRLRWHRGFVFAIRCSVLQWQKYGAAIRKRVPIRELDLEGYFMSTPDWMGMLPTMLGLTSLKIWGPYTADQSRLEWIRSQLPGVRVTHRTDHLR